MSGILKNVQMNILLYKLVQTLVVRLNIDN